MRQLEHIVVAQQNLYVISARNIESILGNTYLGVFGQKFPLAIVWHQSDGQHKLLAIDEERIDRAEIAELIWGDSPIHNS